jgi:hypothetical protein
MNRIQVFSQRARGCGNHPQMRAGNYGPQMAQISQTGAEAVDFSPVTAIFHLISRVFRPFLSHKELVSRRLGRKRGLFKTGREERFKMQAQRVSREADGGCTIRLRNSGCEFGMVRDSSRACCPNRPFAQTCETQVSGPIKSPSPEIKMRHKANTDVDFPDGESFPACLHLGNTPSPRLLRFQRTAGGGCRQKRRHEAADPAPATR